MKLKSTGEPREKARFSETDHRTTREGTDLHRVSRSTHLITKEFVEGERESHDLFFLFFLTCTDPTDLCRDFKPISYPTRTKSVLYRSPPLKERKEKKMMKVHHTDRG